MDEMKHIESNNDSNSKIDFYRQRKAKNISISVMLYVFSVVALIAISCIPEMFGKGNEDKNGIFGVLVMLILAGIATGLIVYTKLSTPSEIETQLSGEAKEKRVSVYKNSKNKKVNAIINAFWPFVLVIYLGVSFFTNAWHITWMIWLIAVAVRNAIIQFTNADFEEKENGDQ